MSWGPIKTLAVSFILVYIGTFSALYVYEQGKSTEPNWNPVSWVQTSLSEKHAKSDITKVPSEATTSATSPSSEEVIDRLSALEKLYESVTKPTRIVYETISQTIDNTVTKTETFNIDKKASDFLPEANVGNPIFFKDNDWDPAEQIYLTNSRLGIGRSPTTDFDVSGNSRMSGTLTLDKAGDGNVLSLTPSGNTGHLSSVGGALYINNTNNIGSGLGIFSDAGADALGNMINIKVNNPEFQNAAFYMDSYGTSNAVEIRNNTDDRSSNALSVTNFNKLDSAIGVKGYELDRGTIKVTNIKAGDNANASGISVDLQGEGGTAAQGIYVDSTADGGTTGKLLRLRNQTVDRFVVEPTGSLVLGATGTNTSITKKGNATGDEFFVGTTGAFRVQRTAASSEAFRVQVSGDSYGRWLGTSDGKLRWSSGSADYDVQLERSGEKTLRLTNAILEARSPAVNSDIMRWQGASGARLGRFLETGGGHGWFEVSNSSGNALVRFRADGGDNFITGGNLGINTTSFGTNADGIVSIGNATPPSISIADGVQLFAVDFDQGDGSSTSELQVRDEDGNVTTISPHNFSAMSNIPRDDLDWAYFSQKNGTAINVNMAEVVRLVEQLSGQQLIYLQDLRTGTQLRTADNLNTQISTLNGLSLPTIQSIHEDVIALQKHLQGTQSGLSVLSPLTHVATVVFKAPVSFYNALIFDNDLAGETTISAGANQIEILLPSNNIPEDYRAVISVTPRSFIDGDYRVEKNQSSFTLILEQEQPEDVLFDWLVVFSK